MYTNMSNSLARLRMFSLKYSTFHVSRKHPLYWENNCQLYKQYFASDAINIRSKDWVHHSRKTKARHKLCCQVLQNSTSLMDYQMYRY